MQHSKLSHRREDETSEDKPTHVQPQQQQQQQQQQLQISRWQPMERMSDDEGSDRMNDNQSYQPTTSLYHQLVVSDQQQLLASSSTSNVLLTPNQTGFYNNIIRRENRLKMHKRKATSGVKFEDWDPDVREKKVKKFVQACSDGNFVQMYKLFREGVDINAKDRYDESGLYNAANEGHYSIVKFLVKHGASIDTANSGQVSTFEIKNICWKIHNQQTALWIASYNGKFKVVRRLLKLGATKQLRCSPLIDNTTPEEIAREQGFEEIAAYIRNFDAENYHILKNCKKRFKTRLVNQQQLVYSSNTFVDITIQCSNEYYDPCQDEESVCTELSLVTRPSKNKRPKASNANLALEPFSSVLYVADQPYYIYTCECCKAPFFSTLSEYDHYLLHKIEYHRDALCHTHSMNTAISTSSFLSQLHALTQQDSDGLMEDDNQDAELPPIECPNDFEVGNGRLFFRSTMASDVDMESIHEVASLFFEPCVLPVPVDQLSGDMFQMLKRFHTQDSSVLLESDEFCPKKKKKFDS
ncbi:hypothetical protein C9374_008501 [Naegleria lovaniensis]|uniref:C2H2-type domain-containing protein n=1 Tax=Naegleria lovaniensis TaxID=51637 RepID=A0AA88KHZ8_NAELO|nr:uncharacterized protein C9374_008501 [Naegleria lovaniensis]KAG2378358.1 hypothetical protein C9374_008501 [Naegleria lovaniensis]